MSASYPYLGSPGSMVALPHPNGAFDNPETRGEQTFDLLSGGVGVRRRLAVKRSWSLPYMAQPGDGVETLLRSFYLGLYGSPLAYVDPSVSNVLGLDLSTCGIRPQASPGWVGSAGTVTVDGTQVTPQTGSAVVKWAAPGASQTLRPGVTAGVANTLKAPVVLTPENADASLWVKASGTGAVFRLDYFDTTGAYISSGTTVAVSTSWARANRSLFAGAAPGNAAFFLPTVFTTGTPANVWIAGAQVEYGVTSASTWQPGFGSPRVRITGSMGRNVPLYGQSTHTLNLAEV